jgi:hypothetical protein
LIILLGVITFETPYIVIAYRVQFEHHKPLAGWEKVDNLEQDLLLERFD